MKFMKKDAIYKAQNVTFNPKTKEAFSYGWWRFVGLIEGKLIFNNYRYSPSTAKHQAKVRSLLNELGIKIDIELPIRAGLPHPESSITLADLILKAEEHLCEKFLEDILKKQERKHFAQALASVAKHKARILAQEQALTQATTRRGHLYVVAG